MKHTASIECEMLFGWKYPQCTAFPLTHTHSKPTARHLPLSPNGGCKADSWDGTQTVKHSFTAAVVDSSSWLMGSLKALCLISLREVRSGHITSGPPETQNHIWSLDGVINVSVRPPRPRLHLCISCTTNTCGVKCNLQSKPRVRRHVEQLPPAGDQVTLHLQSHDTHVWASLCLTAYYKLWFVF